MKIRICLKGHINSGMDTFESKRSAQLVCTLTSPGWSILVLGLSGWENQPITRHLNIHHSWMSTTNGMTKSKCANLDLTSRLENKTPEILELFYGRCSPVMSFFRKKKTRSRKAHRLMGNDFRRHWRCSTHQLKWLGTQKSSKPSVTLKWWTHSLKITVRPWKYAFPKGIQSSNPQLSGTNC